MYIKEILDFFRRHGLYSNEAYSYVDSHSEFFDYSDLKPRAAMGFAPDTNNETKLLDKFVLCIPHVIDYNTLLININLFAKGFIAYKYLGKKFMDQNRLEALALLYEKLFIIESKNKSLEDFGLHMDQLIDESSDENYKFAKYARDNMISEYDKDLNKMDELSKELVKKYYKHSK